ncbi:MAG TPA: PQQ-binding-like beta-propeller repeat protein, partial [Gemmataceae bacterium]|nr:PQQ-binding-like beta-propeller repeat protein [Gemmataceae bacterium]
AAWWKKSGDRIDLARVEAPRLLGYTLVVELHRGLNGRVLELGPDNKPRWEIDNLQYPIDAQVVGDDRVLIAEYRNRRVTERDFKGEVKWEKSVNGIVQGVQRLPHDHTLIVTRNQILEVDADGKETFSHVRNGHDILAARRARTGEVVLVTLSGTCIRLDAAGNEVKSFPVGATYFMGSNIDVLPNGRILVPQFSNNRVVEFDPDGKVVWEAAVASPHSVQRLPNGNTLVGSMILQRAVELDRSGKEVWEYKADGRLMRVRRR